MKLSITHNFSFEAAHFLPRHKGKCKNLHGHTFEGEVEIEGETINDIHDEEDGMIIDFSKVKQIVNECIEEYDHTLLNEKIENPTAELFVKLLFVKLKNRINTFNRKVVRVRLYESKKSYAEVKG